MDMVGIPTNFYYLAVEFVTYTAQISVKFDFQREGVSAARGAWC
jgi:hypothetical protein